MFTVIETEHNDSGMSQRYVGRFDKKKDAWKAIKRECNEHFRSIGKRDYNGFDYKSRGENEYMAWLDVVCSNDTQSFTWAIFDEMYVGARHGRWIG